MLVFVCLALHICCQLELGSMGLRISGQGRGVDRHGPHLGAVTGLHQKFVKRELDRWTNDVKGIRGGDRMTDAFAMVHQVCGDGGGREKGRGTKVGRKEGGEAKQSILKTRTGCGNGELQSPPRHWGHAECGECPCHLPSRVGCLLARLMVQIMPEG